MHESAMTLMRNFAIKYKERVVGAKVLDVGSQDINGTFKGLFKDASEYIGIDLLPGKGVDIVLDKPYEYPFPDEHFDIIISGNFFEHCRDVCDDMIGVAIK